MCQAFACLPSELDAELERTPAQLLDAIVEARAYAAVKAEYRASAGRPDAETPTGLLAELVMALEQERRHG